jgi:hypothetical protein
MRHDNALNSACAGASCSCQAPWHVGFECGCSFTPASDPVRSMVIGMRPRLRGPRRNRWCSRRYRHGRFVSGVPPEGALSPKRVIVPGLLPGIAGAWGDGCGRGPRPDPAVAAQHAAWHPRVLGRVLQAPHRIGTDADHVVAVPDGIPGGLDPGHPGMPGSVPLMLLPAQQMRDAVPGQLHDRR